LPPSINRRLWFYVELILVLVLLAFTGWVRGTRFGASLIAIREDETGAEMRGIDTNRNNVLVFSLSGFITGLFGGMWAYQNTFVDPDIAFFELRTVETVMGTMLGGLGSVMGPVVGSVALYWLREILWANFLDFHLTLQGFLLSLIVLYLPKGIVGLFNRDAWLAVKFFGERESTWSGMSSSLDSTDDDTDTAAGIDDAGDAADDAADDRDRGPGTREEVAR